MLNVLEKEASSYLNKLILTLLLILVPIVPNPIKIILILLLCYIASLNILLHFKKKHADILKISDLNMIFYIIILYNVYLLFVFNFSIQGYTRIIQLICCYIIFMTGYLFTFSKNDILLVKVIIYILSCFFIFDTYFNYQAQTFSGDLNGNTIGMYFLCLMFVYLVIIYSHKLLDNVVIMILMLIVFFSNSRSSFYSLVLVFAIYLIIKNKYLNIYFFKIIFHITLMGIFCFSVIYPILYFTEFGIALNNFYLEYTNRNFFSGRQTIWANIISEVYTSPWIGFGLDKTPSDIYSTSLSSHNFYYQILLQSGLVGLFLILFLIYKIHNRIALNLHLDKARILLLFLYAILIQQTFEVALTQNNLAFGLITWFLFGFGCSTEPVIKIIKGSNMHRLDPRNLHRM